MISYILPGTALIVGYLGLLTPFPFFPPIVFCQVDGEYQFAFELALYSLKCPAIS
jgi:hypothetical protein